MLVWTNRGRSGVLTVFAVLVVVLLLAPLAVVLAGAVARQWTGVLPSSLTARHLRDAFAADDQASLIVSLQTAVVAGAVAVAVGTWAALVADGLSRVMRGVVDTVFMLPAGVPSVVIGFGLLVAYSRPPVVLNGTRTLVIAAQTALVLSFAYSTVSAGIARLDRALFTQAASLGARPLRVLLTIRLPLLLPSIGAATALAMALCMGELGATIMVYPPSWRTLPVTIYTLSDRGNVFLASATTLVLLVVTALLLAVIGRLSAAMVRRT